MRMAGCEAADKEEDEEEYLGFRTGASGSGMTESGTGESGMGTDVFDVCILVVTPRMRVLELPLESPAFVVNNTRYGLEGFDSGWTV